MKWLFKWIFRLVFLVIVIVVTLVLTKDAILKTLVERQIRSQTGMDVKIGKFSAGILSPVVDIERFKLYNPPEFGGTPFLDIPELHVEYDRFALASRRLHVTLLRVSLAELNVVKNGAGHTNVTNLRWNAPSRGAGVRAQVQFPVIDVLNLSVIKARFMDLKNPKHNREYHPNLQNQIFRDVKSEDDVKGILFIIWLRSGGGFTTAPDVLPAEAGGIWHAEFHLRESPFLSTSRKSHGCRCPT